MGTDDMKKILVILILCIIKLNAYEYLILDVYNLGGYGYKIYYTNEVSNYKGCVKYYDYKTGEVRYSQSAYIGNLINIRKNTERWIKNTDFIKIYKNDIIFLNDLYTTNDNSRIAFLNYLYNDNDFSESNYKNYSDYEILYNEDGLAVVSVVDGKWAGLYDDNEKSSSGILYNANGVPQYNNGETAVYTTETDENGNLIYKIITSDTSKALIHSFADQLKKLAENTEIRLFAGVMVIVGGFVAFRLVKRGLNWMKMEPYYSDLDKAYEAYKKGEVGDFTLNKALGRDYKRYKMKNSQWHYGKNGKVVFDNTDGVMSFREFSKNRLKDRWKYKNQYDAKKNEGFKKYVDKKQKIEDLEFKRLTDEELSAEDYRKKYEKEINGFLVHHMNNYRSYDETFLRKDYMEKGIYNEDAEAEIQNMLNIIEEENKRSDQEFFDKQEQIYNESPIDSMEWHYPISEARCGRGSGRDWQAARLAN